MEEDRQMEVGELEKAIAKIIMEGSCVVININIKPITINMKSINIPYQTFTRKVLTDK